MLWPLPEPMIALVSEASLPPVPPSSRTPRTETGMPTPARPPWMSETEGGKGEMGEPFKAGTQLLPAYTWLDPPSLPWGKEGVNLHST